MGEHERAARDNERTNSSLGKRRKRRLDFAGVRGLENNELLPDCSRRNLHIFSVPGVVRPVEHANSRRRGHKLTQLLESFRPYHGREKAYACEVPARPIEVSDQAILDRVATGREDDRHCRCYGFGCECRDEISDDHRDRPMNKIVHKSCQFIAIVFRKAIFDRNILTLNITGFL
jgi:hypothetical protein